MYNIFSISIINLSKRLKMIHVDAFHILCVIEIRCNVYTIIAFPASCKKTAFATLRAKYCGAAYFAMGL